MNLSKEEIINLAKSNEFNTFLSYSNPHDRLVIGATIFVNKGQIDRKLTMKYLAEKLNIDLKQLSGWVAAYRM